MTLAKLRASLALWRRRNAYRQQKLDVAHQRDDKKAIAKWEKLRREAGDMIERRLDQIDRISGPRARIVAAAQQAARNYRANPSAYHYLMGGKANTVVMEPTPRDWRSDCSQFVAGVYKAARVPCPGSGTYLYTNTNTLANGGGARITTKPKPGDVALYAYGGDRYRTHHCELYIGDGKYIGHGTRAIDGITPGLPSFFVTYPQLD